MKNLIIPNHIAIIMDGNNRWAKQKLLSSMSGHKSSVKVVRETVRYCATIGVKVLSLYAFSSENWSRPQAEVDVLMNLFLSAIKSEVASLQENGVRLKFLGSRNKLSKNLLEQMQNAENATKNGERMLLQIAIDYGARAEIVEATKNIAKLVLEKKIAIEDINEECFASNLYTNIDIDLCIRTSGEQRLSNFLLWQNAYAEFHWTNVFFPDFKNEDIDKAILDFNQRTRRFGKTDAQLADS